MIDYIAKMNAAEEVYAAISNVPFPAGLNETYSFISYGDSEGTTELAHGTASATGIKSENYIQIIVETNSVDGFVGNRYWVTKDAEAGDNQLYELFTDDEGQTSTGMFVKIDNIQ